MTKDGRFGVADRAIVNDASKAVAAVPASIPNADRLTEAQVAELDAWAFNIMLECAGTTEPLTCSIGGAVLDLRDLRPVLEWAQKQHERSLEDTP